jgi:hypothetical protein
MTLVCMFDPLVTPPSHLPDPEPLFAFDMSEKKQEIFRDARERIRSKAQYTRSGRKPWTQMTVSIPIPSSSTTEDQDLAVVWALMRESTRTEVSENASGDLTWKLLGSEEYFEWLETDWKNMKPVHLYVHPVKYETGARKKTILETKLRKAQRSQNLSEVARIEQELSNLEHSQSNSQSNSQSLEPRGHHYHWSNYEECHVIYKKKQPRKDDCNELQLTIKIRTYYLGNGVPEENNGYLQGCSMSEGFLDPNADIYHILKSIGR